MPDFGDFATRAGDLAIRVTVAIAVVVGFVVAARLATPLVRRVLDRRGRPSHTRVFTGLFRVAVVLIGCLISLTLAFPSVRVADVLAIFGIVSVAAGFAFKDTFENLLAGVLLLLRDPFMSGDQVTIADRDGTVEGVTVRETLLRGHDGRRYFIPNAKVLTDVIEVETDDAKLRQSFSLRLDPATDFAVLRTTLRDSIHRAEGVCPDPAPEVLLVDVVNGEVEVRCRFWSGSRRREATAARDHAIAAAMAAVVERAIPLSVDELRVELTGRDAPGGGHAARDSDRGKQ